jgi:UDP-N-acetylmuramoyl-L-alanyl-D-glutamate--2,6-diaminopimelate ligase
MKMLRSLLDGLLIKQVYGPVDIPVSGIVYHSGRVRPGCLFVCLQGRHGGGESFVREAVAAGAVAVISSQDLTFAGVTTVRVPEPRLALALLAAEFYDYPSRELVLTGVTGTNGKTTTTHLIDALFHATGKVTGLIGTVGYRLGEENMPALATTPEASDLQELLRQMSDGGVTHVTMEVSSHALALYRTIGCDFDTVVLTNITEDHLDFHHTFQRYLDAKTRLFSWLGSLPRKGGSRRRAIINGDDSNWPYIYERVPGEVLLYGLGDHCQVRAAEVGVTREGVSFNVITPDGSLSFRLKLTGLFSVYNALAATCCGLLAGMGLERIRAVLAEVPGVPGRFELVDEGQEFTVIVDYAHTPDGLDNVLRAVREFAGRRVITVFGCGGERDRSKRPLMGETAGNYSDISIVTSDNPRGEEPGLIISEILPGLERSRHRTYEVIPDRKLAISRAVELAEPGDVVVIAGKGHETEQVFRDFTIPFDDRVVVREVIRRFGRHGDELQRGTGGGGGQAAAGR